MLIFEPALIFVGIVSSFLFQCLYSFEENGNVVIALVVFLNCGSGLAVSDDLRFSCAVPIEREFIISEVTFVDGSELAFMNWASPETEILIGIRLSSQSHLETPP